MNNTHRIQISQPDFKVPPVLDHNKAKARLNQLPPGTEEYSQLQNALIRTHGIVEISLKNASYKVNTVPACQALLGGFGSSEHIAIGMAVTLKGLDLDDPNPHLMRKGDTSIFFSHIVALAGDFYGIVGRPIAFGISDIDKTDRFKKAFESLFNAEAVEIERIVMAIDQEYSSVRYAGLPHHCYSTQLMQKSKAIKNIKADIDELLVDNSDHFSENAKKAYLCGHMFAIEKAREAGTKKDTEGLRLAYAMEAFACHFLTDLFSAGHIRNQRGELEKYLVNNGYSDVWARRWAGLLTGAQHEYDGKLGLNVKNSRQSAEKRCERWRAYGDGSFFIPKSVDNKKKAIEAVQQSVDEIYKAYEGVSSLTASTSSSVSDNAIPPTDVLKLIPTASQCNHFPLYRVEGDKLLLYKDGIMEEITKDHRRRFIELALEHLPKSYVNDFIDSFIASKLPKADEIERLQKMRSTFQVVQIAAKNIINPRIERLTGRVWNVVGIASYRQIDVLDKKLNSKIDEMAEAIQEVYLNTQVILDAVTEIKNILEDINWGNKARYIYDPVQEIKHKMKMYQSRGHIMSENDLRSLSKELIKASVTVGMMLQTGPVQYGSLVKEYSKLLKSQGSLMKEKEIKIAATLWFRQMLEYRFLAFSISESIKEEIGEAGQVYEELRILNNEIEDHVKANTRLNEELIIGELVCESPAYILLQLQKERIRQSAFQALRLTQE